MNHKVHKNGYENMWVQESRNELKMLYERGKIRFHTV